MGDRNTLCLGDVEEVSCRWRWWWWWVILVKPITSSCDSISRYGGYSGNNQFKLATRCLYVEGGGSILTQHQSRDTVQMVNGHSRRVIRPTRHTATNFIFYNIILGLGKTTKSQDQFPAIQKYYADMYRTNYRTSPLTNPEISSTEEPTRALIFNDEVNPKYSLEYKKIL